MSNDPDSAKKAEQHARFLETARALGCDEDEAAFDEKLRGISRQGFQTRAKGGKGNAKNEKGE